MGNEYNLLSINISDSTKHSIMATSKIIILILALLSLSVQYIMCAYVTFNRKKV